MKKTKLTYSQVGDDYSTKDPIKKVAQVAAKRTSKNLRKYGFTEISSSRGESAFVWQQGSVLMASVIEGLGTKNLVADTMRLPDKTYYDVIGHDTVATIINDLITVGAKPLVVNAYWAVEDNSWLSDKKRMQDLIKGWENACNLSGGTWGGGETPTLKGIVKTNTAEFGGSAVGIISPVKNLIGDANLKDGDRIILLKSSGINANGLSLAREIARRLPKSYETKVSNSKTYGELLLQKTNIYATLIADLLKNKIPVHYISNITGHGLRKIMRSTRSFTYIIEKLYPKSKLFSFMQEHAGISDSEAYGTWNMGQDYCLFVPKSAVGKTLAKIKKNGFVGLDAGYIEKGKRQVILKGKNVTYSSETLDLR